MNGFQINKMAEQCRKSVEYYRDNPGHIGPTTIENIYLNLAMLCDHLLDKQKAEG